MIYHSYEGPNEKGAYPGDELLAEHIDRAPRTVRRHRSLLIEEGYLRQELRGPQAARYWTAIPERDGENPEPSEDSASLWREGEIPDGDSFPSAFFVDGVREVLWLDEEPPDAAPEGWDVGADLADLRTAWKNLGSERLRRSLLGLRLLADAGELPGVEPGDGFTLGLMKRLRGRGLWRAAEEAYRREHEEDDDQEGGPGPLEEAAGELLAEMEEAAHG